jgi:hypothetical protein
MADPVPCPPHRVCCTRTCSDDDLRCSFCRHPVREVEQLIYSRGRSRVIIAGFFPSNKTQPLMPDEAVTVEYTLNRDR